MTAVALEDGLERYRAAIAELAPRSHRAAPAGGVVRILDGTGDWCRRLEAARREGAAAIVVDEPAPASDLDHERIADLGIPVIVNRRRLRPDLVAHADSGAAPRLVTADGFGPRSSWRSWARDVVGWARILAGSPLEPVVLRASVDVLLLALVTDAGVPATATCTLLEHGSAVTIDAAGLDAHRVEVRIDDTAGISEVATVSEAGRLIAPTPFESSERLALRRAIDAFDRTTLPPDLADLRRDDALVRSLSECAVGPCRP
jgi:hypothetical protein